MIKFLSIRVQDYKSIEDTTIIIEPGMYKVVGDSQGYSSNGSGKTTVTQAITIALFNRDFSGAKLDEVSNRVTGRGFKITLAFKKDDKEYVVVNNRQRNSMSITTNGETITTGVKDTVRFISSTLGMGYDTFCLTHFITAKTVGHITENLSSPTLFNDILQISQLKELDTKFHQLGKKLKEESDSILKELSSAQSVSSVLELTGKYDVPRLREELAANIATLNALNIKLIKKRKALRPIVKELSNLLSETTSEIRITKEALDNGVCGTCGTILASSETSKELTSSLTSLTEKRELISLEYESKKEYTDISEAKITDKVYKVEGRIVEIEQDLRVAEELDMATKHHEGFDIQAIASKLGHSKDLEKFVTYARTQIKEGNVVKELLENFFLIVSVKIRDYSTLINMNGMVVSIMANKLGMGVTLQKGDEFIPVSTLSNGEKTRLSLLVLISMLAAMKEVSNAETNYLVFDEASSSFDASGVLELEALFSYMKNMGQACFVITHGTEMNKVAFDHIVLLSKSEGISTCQVTAI